LQLGGGEKYPLINLKSTKSIIFEQNLFGILCFYGFWITFFSSHFHRRPSKISGVIFLAGLFLSYFKTVIIIAMIMVFYGNIGYITLISGFVFIGLTWFWFADDVLLLLQLEQNGLTSGRVDLWNVAINIWQNNPFFGIGESAIPTSIYNYIQRSPPFTTFHNFFFDILASSGLLGVVFIFIQFILIFLYINNGRKINYMFLLLPSLFNTYYIGAPNAIGLFLIIVFQYYRTNPNSLNKSL
jgi:O-antigen ligase